MNLKKESLSNYFNVKTFRNERFEISKYGSIMLDRIKIIRQSQNRLARLNFHQKFSISIGIFLNFLMGVYAVKTGTLLPGDLVFLNMLTAQIFGPLFNLGNNYRLWQESFYELNELLTLLGKNPRIEDKPDAIDFEIKDGSVEFENVTFSFWLKNNELNEMQEIRQADSSVSKVTSNDKPSFVQKMIKFFDKFIVFEKEENLTKNTNSPAPQATDKNTEQKNQKQAQENLATPKSKKIDVLKNFSIKINGGDVILLTGSSGVGKSTIASFLVRFFDPEEGCIKVDGQKLESIKLDSLRSGVCYCPQNHYFFNDSFINNIKFANIEKYFDVQAPEDSKKKGDEYIKYTSNSGHVDSELNVEREIYELVRDFDLLSVVEAQEEGWDYNIGDNGDKLSGGQKQRLNLIRALIKKSQIYVFDEPTNFLDSINKMVVDLGFFRFLF